MHSREDEAIFQQQGQGCIIDSSCSCCNSRCWSRLGVSRWEDEHRRYWASIWSEQQPSWMDSSGCVWFDLGSVFCLHYRPWWRWRLWLVSLSKSISFFMPCTYSSILWYVIQITVLQLWGDVEFVDIEWGKYCYFIQITNTEWNHSIIPSWIKQMCYILYIHQTSLFEGNQLVVSWLYILQLAAA